MVHAWVGGGTWPRGLQAGACGPTRDVRHRAKIAVERYPASGDETRAVLKELTAALAAQPKTETLPGWRGLKTCTSMFEETLEDMRNPNLDAEHQRAAGAAMMEIRRSC